MSYDTDAIWMTRSIERVYNLGVPSRLLANLVSVGGVPLLLSALYFRLAVSQPTTSYLTAHLLLAVLLSAIGYLVWYYDERLMAAFFTQLEPLLANQNDLDRVADKYTSFFAREYWKTLLLWVPLGPIVFWGNRTFLATQGIGGPTDPVFWVYAAFATVASLYTGVGIHVILTTLLSVGEVSTLDFQIDPLNTDGLGGMGTIGWFSVRTMAIASVGSFGMPIAFELVTGGSFEIVIYAAVAAYVSLLIGIFIYPTLIATRHAEELRTKHLELLKGQIENLEAELDSLTSRETPANEIVAKQLELQRRKENFKEYDSVSLYPLSVGVLARFAGSILLPLGFLLVDYYLPKLL